MNALRVRSALDTNVASCDRCVLVGSLKINSGNRHRLLLMFVFWMQTAISFTFVQAMRESCTTPRVIRYE
jgi:hypothetical protein